MISPINFRAGVGNIELSKPVETEAPKTETVTTPIETAASFKGANALAAYNKAFLAVDGEVESKAPAFKGEEVETEDASKAPIEAAKAYCEAKGVEVIEKTGTTNDEIALAADALIAGGAEAVFTPTDNTVMTAELAIYEKFIDAGIPHYAGADSFALNGAFLGFGVNYVDLGTATADMVADILVNGADPASTPVVTLDNGIATVNTDTAEAIGLDYRMVEGMCAEVKETVTAEEFE